MRWYLNKFFGSSEYSTKSIYKVMTQSCEYYTLNITTILTLIAACTELISGFSLVELSKFL